MYVLDTDVLIDIQRGYAPAVVWFATLSEMPAIPGFCGDGIDSGRAERTTGAAGAQVGSALISGLAD